MVLKDLKRKSRVRFKAKRLIKVDQDLQFLDLQKIFMLK